jgi:hypothetical protein
LNLVRLGSLPRLLVDRETTEFRRIMETFVGITAGQNRNLDKPPLITTRG